MKRRIYIIPKSMEVKDALAEAVANNCPEIVHGIPGVLTGIIGEQTLPTVYEEPEAPPQLESEWGVAEKGTPGASISDKGTLLYQIDRILDDLQHLETEHLPARGLIDDTACDCIAKAARDLRRHALETIPIASRQEKDAEIYSELALLASHLMEIGTSEAVKSGRYDNEYLTQAGTISQYRKQIQALLSELKTRDRNVLAD